MKLIKKYKSEIQFLFQTFLLGLTALTIAYLLSM